jgi:PDZ domain
MGMLVPVTVTYVAGDGGPGESETFAAQRGAEGTSVLLETYGVSVSVLINQRSSGTRIIPWHRIYELSYPPLGGSPQRLGLSGARAGTPGMPMEQSRVPRLGVSVLHTGAGSGGLKISQLDEECVARRVGLRVGDVILGVDGANVTDPGSLRRAVTSKSKGEQVELKWRRDGEVLSGSAPL